MLFFNTILRVICNYNYNTQLVKGLILSLFLKQFIMKTIKLSILFVVISLFVSCKTSQKSTSHKESTSTSQQVEHHKKHWSYVGENDPNHWSNISEEYKACSGKKQSPIDIEDAVVVTKKQPNVLKVNFGNTKTDIINNGHTIEFKVDKGNYVTFNGKKYELKQFHMHSLSEHTLNHKHFPLEIHFVSKADDGTYAVIAVFFKEGKASPFFSKFLDKLPAKEGEVFKSNTSFDLKDVLADTKHFYHYNGSFTTPPCTEIVEWILLKEPKTASKEQLDKLHSLLKDNYRPVQKLNGRVEDVQ